jgi:hypothetical protein
MVDNRARVSASSTTSLEVACRAIA